MTDPQKMLHSLRDRTIRTQMKAEFTVKHMQQDDSACTCTCAFWCEEIDARTTASLPSTETRFAMRATEHGSTKTPHAIAKREKRCPSASWSRFCRNVERSWYDPFIKSHLASNKTFDMHIVRWSSNASFAILSLKNNTTFLMGYRMLAGEENCHFSSLPFFLQSVIVNSHITNCGTPQTPKLEVQMNPRDEG